MTEQDKQRIERDAQKWSDTADLYYDEKGFETSYIAGATREHERMAELLKETVAALETAVREIETVDGLGLDRIVLKMKAVIEKAKGKSQ